MSSIEALIAQARSRARKPAPGLTPRPRLRIVILTCMDARIDPVELFGLAPGDAHVLRNAGARSTPDVLRSLALSQAILGTREVLVLGHTRCGLLGRTERELVEAIRLKSGHKPDTEVGAFQNLEKAVAETVETLRRCPFLTYRDRIQGYVYDVDTGSGRPVDVPERGGSTLRSDVLNLKPSPTRPR
jgi:carbonic anhydrase